MKTLYTRIVIVYIITVMISLVIGFFTLTLLYREILGSEQEEMFIKQGKGIITLFREFDDMSELKNVANELLKPMLIDFTIYDSEGAPEVFGTVKRSISEERIQQVLKGGVYREEGSDPNNPIVGLPFQKMTNNMHYLFMSVIAISTRMLIK